MSWRNNPAPFNPTGATAICFNDYNSLGSPFVADLLVDAGILIALLDDDDEWHDAVEDFFANNVYDAEYGPTFYITHDIINEILHRLEQNHIERTGNVAPMKLRQDYAESIVDMLRTGTIELVTLSLTTTLEAIGRWANRRYGAKDAFHASCQLDWGLDLITVDHQLMIELENDPDFSGRKVFCPDLTMKKQRTSRGGKWGQQRTKRA